MAGLDAILETAPAERPATGFVFTEGPLWHPDDYYYFDEASHSLIGRRSKRRYRLGDKVRVTVVRVDLQRRQLDFRVCPRKKKEE